MENKEFNLSEKIIKGKDIHNGEAEFVNTFIIKEFIRMLKKITFNNTLAWSKINEEIDKLAGDKLI